MNERIFNLYNFFLLWAPCFIAPKVSLFVNFFRHISSPIMPPPEKPGPANGGESEKKLLSICLEWMIASTHEQNTLILNYLCKLDEHKYLRRWPCVLSMRSIWNCTCHTPRETRCYPSLELQRPHTGKMASPRNHREEGLEIRNMKIIFRKLQVIKIWDK